MSNLFSEEAQPTRGQIESAIIFGIAGTLYGEVTFKEGRVEQAIEQANFHNYRVLCGDWYAGAQVAGGRSSQACLTRLNMAT